MRESEVDESKVASEILATAFGAIESRKFPVSSERRLANNLVLLLRRLCLFLSLNRLDDVDVAPAKDHEKREALPRKRFFESDMG